MQDKEVIQAFSSHASQKAFAVSGKQRDDQAATGECGALAARRLTPSSPTPINVPTAPPRAPVLWKDWPRCAIRRRWLKVVRSETVSLMEGFPTPTRSSTTVSSVSCEAVLTRAERTHWRLSWEQRLARNARPPDASRLVATFHGLPATSASSFGFALLATSFP